MKRRLMAFILAVMYVALCGNAAASSTQVDEAIAAMEDNIDSEALKMLDGTVSKFEQKIVYDEKTNTFTHYVYYPAFIIPGYALTLDGLDPDTIPSWERLWEVYREFAELWLFNDAIDAMKVKDSSIVIKFVTALDENAEDYIEMYSLKIDSGYKVTILKNVFTDDYEPVGFKQ